jgi:hypothetical protein
MSYFFGFNSSAATPVVPVSATGSSTEAEFVVAGQPGKAVQLDMGETVVDTTRVPPELSTRMASVFSSPPPCPSVPSIPPPVEWKGVKYTLINDENCKRQVLRFLGAQHAPEDVEYQIRQLVQDNHASIECSDSASFTFSGINSSLHYHNLNRLTSVLPAEWTRTLVQSMDSLFQSVSQLLTNTEVAETQFVDVNVYQAVSNPRQMLVVHGSYSSSRPGKSRVADLLFGASPPSATLTAHIRVIGLAPSFMRAVYLAPSMSLRRLQDAIVM